MEFEIKKGNGDPYHHRIILNGKDITEEVIEANVAIMPGEREMFISLLTHGDVEGIHRQLDGEMVDHPEKVWWEQGDDET